VNIRNSVLRQFLVNDKYRFSVVPFLLLFSQFPFCHWVAPSFAALSFMVIRLRRHLLRCHLWLLGCAVICCAVIYGYWAAPSFAALSFASLGLGSNIIQFKILV